MEFDQAALLVALVYGGVEVAKKLFPAGWSESIREKATIAASFVLGIGGSFLVAESAWGNEQVVGNKPLDTLNGYSLVVVGIALALAAVTLHKLIGAVKNVGENQPEYEDDPEGG